MQTLNLQIAGMSCGHCVKAVTAALTATEGVTVGPVAIGSASLQFDPSMVSADDIAQRLADEGYQVVQATQN